MADVLHVAPSVGPEGSVRHDTHSQQEYLQREVR